MPDDLLIQSNSGDDIEESGQSLRNKTDEKEDKTGSMAYPDRPHEPDCVYYLRTGMCGYGDGCKFNHPAYNVQQDNNQHGDGGDLPQRAGEPDCAYFIKTGTCVYGSTCKYNHPRDRLGASPVLLSAVGLPMRQGQESCSHYLRTGSCKFGVGCKFHHPQPAFYGPSPPISGPLPYAPDRISGAHAWPYLSQQTYLPVIIPSTGCTQAWGPYIGNMSPVLSTNGLTSVDHVYPSTQSSHLPVRPGEQECRYFMSTGTCKYGSNCKYHHPMDNMVTYDASSFSPFGLPLKPGRPMCLYYMYGMCKYGPGCKYDHPLMVYSNGLTTLPMVDPLLFSYGVMNSSGSPPSKPLKNTSQKSEQNGNVKPGTDDSVGSSHSLSQNQSD